jgi:peptidoglycan hydrolase-like protein with peptidoglycan-binding domain
LWERSLERSRHRRELAAIARREAPRRKGASLALTAALAAGPISPAALAAADSSSSGEAPAASGDHDLGHMGIPILLHEGSTGPAVAAAQHELNVRLVPRHLVEDGIFGPRTRAAVVDFQARHGLRQTGEIDTGTWRQLFGSEVVAVSGAGHDPASASSPARPQRARIAPAAARRGPRRAVPRLAHRPAAQPRAKRADRTGLARPARSAHLASLPVVSRRSGSSTPTPHSGGFLIVGGIALPLPPQYLTGGSIDQGVDYAAPGGTPLYAMGPGIVIREGIDGFGPDAIVLKITGGPLAGKIIYYGHSGADLVRVGQRVRAGQQISIVGYGRVGISTGPHLEIGFWPLGGMGAGAPMKNLIDRIRSHHSAYRASVSRARYTPSYRSTSHSTTYRSYSTNASYHKRSSAARTSNATYLPDSSSGRSSNRTARATQYRSDTSTADSQQSTYQSQGQSSQPQTSQPQSQAQSSQPSTTAQPATQSQSQAVVAQPAAPGATAPQATAPSQPATTAPAAPAPVKPAQPAAPATSTPAPAAPAQQTPPAKPAGEVQHSEAPAPAATPQTIAVPQHTQDATSATAGSAGGTDSQPPAAAEQPSAKQSTAAPAPVPAQAGTTPAG